MSILDHNLDLRKPDDRREAIARLAAAGIAVEEAAIEFAVRHLTDDWLELKIFDLCVLKSDANHFDSISLVTWAHTLMALYEFGSYPGIDIQIKRLRLPSHEKLDTILVLSVARRFNMRGFAVTLEPFGVGSTDLLVTKDPYRLYIEVKRENPLTHQRPQRIQAICSRISSSVEKRLEDWLRAESIRVEVKLSMLFSDPLAEKVIEEICRKARTAERRTEVAVAKVRGSGMVVLGQQDPAFYKKGIHGASVTVKKAGTPVSLQAGMLVTCIFDALSNLDALGKRISEAGKQLTRDLDRDPSASGLLVLQCSRADNEMCDAIRDRFWRRLPERCLGITLIAPPGWTIPRSDLSDDEKQLLTFAALDVNMN